MLHDYIQIQLSASENHVFKKGHQHTIQLAEGDRVDVSAFWLQQATRRREKSCKSFVMSFYF